MDTVYLETSIVSYLRQRPSSQVDALHIATVAHHRIQYLLTWNCKHIANAKILPRIHQVLTEAGLPMPVICTPEELLGNDSEIDG